MTTKRELAEAVIEAAEAAIDAWKRGIITHDLRVAIAHYKTARDDEAWRPDRNSTHWVRFRERGPWQICHWIAPKAAEPGYWTSWLEPVEIGPALPPPASSEGEGNE